MDPKLITKLPKEHAKRLADKAARKQAFLTESSRQAEALAAARRDKRRRYLCSPSS